MLSSAVHELELEKSTCYFLGSNEKKALPAFFYFSASGKESLSLDPLCQPAQFAKSNRLRVFSFDLPYHPEGADKNHAIQAWKEDLNKGIDPIQPFIIKLKECVNELIQKGWIIPQQMAVGGLSRGAFVACQLAAILPTIHTLLLFAPLTKLSETSNLIHLKEQLADRSIRIYMGNRDEIVSTDACYAFFQAVVKSSTKRSPPLELFINPSIGRGGHGTASTAFQEGAIFIQKQLGTL